MHTDFQHKATVPIRVHPCTDDFSDRLLGDEHLDDFEANML
jgi:hypothetical protein